MEINRKGRPISPREGQLFRVGTSREGKEGVIYLFLIPVDQMPGWWILQGVTGVKYPQEEIRPRPGDLSSSTDLYLFFFFFCTGV
jgi:hypothetical protein